MLGNISGHTAVKAGSVLTALLCAVVFSLATLNPIYEDEIVYLQLASNFSWKDFSSPFIYPQCTSTVRRAVPIPLVPAAALTTAVFSFISSNEALRLMGLLVTGCNALLLLAFVRRSLGARERNIESLILLPLAIGVFPIFLVLARPEGTLFLLAAGLLSISLTTTSSTLIMRFLKGLLSFVIVSIAAWIHPGAATLLPLFLVASWNVGGRGVIGMLCAAVAGAVVVTGVSFHCSGYACHEVPEIESFYSLYSNELSSLSLLPTIRTFFSSILDIQPYIEALLFKTSSGNYWGYYPPVHTQYPILYVIANALGLIPLAILLVMSVATFIQVIRDLSLTERTLKHLPSISVFASIALGALAYPIKYAYRAELFFLLLLLGLALNGELLRVTCERVRHMWIALFKTSIILSMVFLVILLGPPIFESLFEVHPVEQRISVGIFASNIRDDEIKKAANFCQIENYSGATLVDTLTYFYLDDPHASYLESYVFFHDQDPPSARDYLKRIKLRNAFVHCDSVPESSVSEFKRFGDLCCF
ncbi:MAG: hypothetical protein KDD66_08275 [Bdellovibrionales bacterium]|nr:hypothetical protein [Bdellovibrionales bacterium]